MTAKVIGIDFDNTIVCYDEIFHLAALERNLIPADLAKNKENVKNYLRSNGQENIWTELQGYVYGARMLDASPYPAFIEFLKFAKEMNYIIYIISHKTQYPYLGPRYDLHQAARDWIKSHKLFDKGYMKSKHVFFETTITDKLVKIKDTQCAFFIDDLPEILFHENFPMNVNKLLFQPNIHTELSQHKYSIFSSWSDIKEYFLKL